MVSRPLRALALRPDRGARRGLPLVLALAACRSAAPDPPPAPTPPVAAEPEDEPAAPPAVDCGEPVEGIDALLRPGGLVMLGEMHGTRQIPAFVGDLVCAGATRGLAVRLGVELPRGDEAIIEAYLDSEGTPADREALLGSGHWTRPDQDGRSSEAMLALIERVRTLREARLDVDLFPFDVETSGDWNARDASMAERILARASAEPEALVVTLSGNVHNRTRSGLPWSADAVPMGVHVLRSRADAVSLDARYQEGTAWVCRSATECGVAELRGAAPSGERRVVVGAEPDDHGYHGTFSVGAIEAAPPAVDPGEG